MSSIVWIRIPDITRGEIINKVFSTTVSTHYTLFDVAQITNPGPVLLTKSAGKRNTSKHVLLDSSIENSINHQKGTILNDGDAEIPQIINSHVRFRNNHSYSYTVLQTACNKEQMS